MSSTSDRPVAFRPVPHPRRVHCQVAGIALLLGAGLVGFEGLSGAGVRPVPANALPIARTARERAEVRAAVLHDELDRLNARIAQTSASADVITADLARSREALRATAVEAFLEHGRESELLMLLAADRLTDASDRATLLGAGADAAASDVSDYERLRADTSPVLVQLGERRSQLEREVREADDAAAQARAAEADAERAADEAEAEAAVQAAEAARSAATATVVAASSPAATAASEGRTLNATEVQTVAPPDLPPPPTGGPSEQQWAALRRCEAGGNYRAVSRSGRYRGAYQFDQRTWEVMGGHGDPAAASPAEQDLRAKLLYASRGSRPWPICGRHLSS